MLNFLFLAAGFWIWSALFFELFQKPLFLLANHKNSKQSVNAPAVAAIYCHGFVSDAIIASYLTAIPLILGMVQTLVPHHWLGGALTAYNVVISIAVGLLCAGDAVLYGFWHSKVDASVFAYMRSPKGVTASVSGRFLAGWVCVWLLMSAIFFAGAQAITETYTAHEPEEWLPWWGYIIVFLAFALVVALLFTIIRGLKIRPNNPSVVYFSSEPFFNHAALNPGYNLIYSLGTRNEFAGRFRAFDDEECDRIFQPMFPTSGTPVKRLLKVSRPNILVIVWESFGAEFCGALWGRQEVTPCFNALSREGVLFSNCRASSFRTDRALPAIFCGLPGQPTTSIVRYTRKLPNLPSFVRDLRDAGYHTTAVHGGELTIMHKSDFYLSSGHTRLMAEKDFPSGLDKGKWGVHDYPVLDRVCDDILNRSEEESPWLVTVQTLSSHEPFTVPYSRLSDEADNSMAYTDAALGNMVDRLKGKPEVWDNLLMIVVADHGLNRAESSLTREQYCHIPLLFAGGAVKEPAVMDTLMTQTDLAATLLGQLGIDHSHFPFSRDVLADNYTDRTALHTYGNGFLFTDRTGTTDYDNMGQAAAPGTADPQREGRAKAILQKLYEYIDKL